MDRIKIENTTREYWKKSQNIDLDIYLHEYVCEEKNGLGGKSLLEAELDWAEEKNGITAKHCETLVLLVGFSLEPLLQSACVHKPTKIALLLNEEGYLGEEWQVFAQHLIKAIKYLERKGFDGSKTHFLGKDLSSEPGYPAQGDPASVFKALVKVLHNEEDVVIDITGGKKSMVAGAFMYAAYAGARISYVDFEEYDPKERRPYGFGCKIGELSNPYEKFALHEWEQVRILYERYQFRDAQMLLMGRDDKGRSGTVMDAMKNYLPDSEPAIKLLASILCCYEYWDAGLYNEAAKKLQDIKNRNIQFTSPYAVEILDGKWVVTENDHFKKVQFDFYLETPEFRAYVYDELARIGRLIEFNCDYRSAFLRAGSLNEAIMLARLIKLIEDKPKREKIVEILQNGTPTSGAKSVFRNLARSEGSIFQIAPRGRRGDDIITIQGAPEMTISIKGQTNWWMNLSLFDGLGNWEQFIHLRNDLAHKYYTPPRSWAEHALKFVTTNVEDFWGKKQMKTMSSQTTAMSWSKLIDLCGISDYLPPNLR